MKICENCGKDFEPYFKANGKTYILLSRKLCFDCLPYQVPVKNRYVEKKYCIICGKPLQGKQEKYCSKSCKTKSLLGYESQKDKGVERKSYLIQQAGGCCSRCGYDKNLAALQFHHLDPKQKKFKMDARNLSNRGWLSILREFEKCIVLCANCHFEEHHPDLADWQDREFKEVL